MDTRTSPIRLRITQLREELLQRARACTRCWCLRPTRT
jgi:hypothetical protein